MKKLLLITGATVALGVVGVSSAAALAPAGSAGTLPGAYVGVGAGWGGMNTPKLNQADKNLVGARGTHSQDLRGFAARVYGGYLWALPQVQNLQLGAELGYNYYPKNKYSLSTVNGTDSWNYKGYNIDLLGVAKYNFGTSGFNALGKIGPAYVHQKSTFTRGLMVIPANLGGSKNQVKLEGALGVGYDINQNVDVNVIYAHVFGSKPGHVSDVGITRAGMNKVASVDTVLLTVAYHFGDLNLGGIV
jgi:outer membrane immunogenic protein